MDYCKRMGLEAVSVKTTEQGIPASKKERFLWMRSRQLAKQQNENEIRNAYKNLGAGIV